MKYSRDDAFFLKLVENGRLKVERDGSVTNTETGLLIGQKTPLIVLKDGDFRHSISTYALVWIAFNGLVPEGLRVFRKDPKGSCALENLEVMTVSEKNFQIKARMREQGKNVQKFGSANHQARFTDEQVIALRREYRFKPFSVRARAKELGTSHPILSMALRGESYSYLPEAVEVLSKKFSGGSRNKSSLNNLLKNKEVKSTKKEVKPKLPKVDKPQSVKPVLKVKQEFIKPKFVQKPSNFDDGAKEDRLALLKKLGRRMGL